MVHDNPTGWVKRHIDEYVESNGRKGHRWNGVDTLLVTTRGRKSGKLRRTALIYGADGASYVVVASRGGHTDSIHRGISTWSPTLKSGFRWGRSTMTASPEPPQDLSVHVSGR